MKLFCGVACFLMLAPIVAQQPAPKGDCSLVIRVSGARNTKGGIGGLLFISNDGWPDDRDKAVARGTFPITGDKATLKFDHLAAGAYSVVVLHDENLNKKLDRNFLTIPKEGFGFANNPKVRLSAPKMKTASVNLAGPVTEIDIKLIYK